MNFLKEKLIGHGIELSPLQVEQFKAYSSFLIKKNKEFNLTAIREEKDIELYHFLDSARIIPFILEYFKGEKDNFKALKMIDIGTGAGFPGMVIKILLPELNITLLDSLNKRINFLEETVRLLELDGVLCVHGRAEDIAHDKNYREKFDVAVARAVAPLPVLCEYCLPFVKKGGCFASMKSKYEEEISGSKNAVKVLGGEVYRIHEYFLDEKDIYRSLVVTKKTDNSPSVYPRKAGIPKKKPL